MAIRTIKYKLKDFYTPFKVKQLPQIFFIWIHSQGGLISKKSFFYGIAHDKMLFFQSKSIDIFLISPWKRVLWVLISSLGKALLMSTHNICFHREIRKIFTLYPLLFKTCKNSLFLRGEVNAFRSEWSPMEVYPFTINLLYFSDNCRRCQWSNYNRSWPDLFGKKCSCYTCMSKTLCQFHI